MAVATCAVPDVDDDQPLLLAELARAGVDAAALAWDDPAADWGRFDLVVVRSTWDYAPRRGEFLAWARALARVANPYDALGSREGPGPRGSIPLGRAPSPVESWGVAMSKIRGPRGRWTARAVATGTLVASLLTVLGVGTSGAIAFPTVAVSWSPINYTPGTQFDPTGNALAADALGNIYAIVDESLIQQNVASGVTTNVAPSQTFCDAEGLVASPNGYLYVSYYPGCTEPGVIAQVAPNGVVSTFSTGLVDPEMLALSPTGQLFAYGYNGSESGIFLVTGAGATFVGPTSCSEPEGMAVAPDGSIYYTACDVIYRMVGGVSTEFYTGEGYCLGALAIDGLSNVYVSDECGFFSSPFVISPAGVPAILSVPADAPPVEAYCGDDDGEYWIQNSVVIGGSTLYAGYAFCYVDPPSYNVFATSVTPESATGGPPQLGATTRDQVVDGTLGQAITATWNGVPGAVSYTCTLMYGLGVPSSFTVTTPNKTCSFEFLSPSAEFGIQVVANFGDGASSAPSSAFAAPPPLPPSPTPATVTSIVCENNRTHAVKAVTGAHPRCAPGWHRVG